ncbi:c-type cytochrome [Lacibacter sediminis]|uniref:Cytochrome c n=1 Tax=Lacibacter sediminis TaxID=2760713 RepID=A0A7G5XD30_9BACT|nr:c-type cytochrome [Lacibacter sediminis]QNA43383.1 cytochrome c [Lacibacter sediminis]
MKKMLIVFSFLGFVYACNNETSSDKTSGTESTTKTTTDNGNPSYDPERGAGKFTNVDVKPELDKVMAEAGLKVYDVKCGSCHKLTDEKLVGPGWKGVTTRHKPEWIMNFVTNVDEMLNKDPKAMAQLELCLVRMPNQNLTDDDARHVYEFMRKNDGVK